MLTRRLCQCWCECWSECVQRTYPPAFFFSFTFFLLFLTTRIWPPKSQSICAGPCTSPFSEFSLLELKRVYTHIGEKRVLIKSRDCERTLVSSRERVYNPTSVWANNDIHPHRIPSTSRKIHSRPLTRPNE